jgi:hypothetical protein
MQTKIANECFINEPIALFYDTLGVESVRKISFQDAYKIKKVGGNKSCEWNLKWALTKN